MSNSTGKALVSNILHYGTWHNADDVKPAEGQKVVIRMVDPDINHAITSNEKEILLDEDQKVAVFARDYDDKSNGVWIIQPPHLKYDFSRLSKRDKINDGVKVTHWREATETELTGWNNRLDPFNKYQQMIIKIDPEFEEGMYRSFVLSSHLLSQESRRYKAYAERCKNEGKTDNYEYALNESDNFNKMANAMMDLQCCIDHGKCFINGEFVKYNVDSESIVDEIMRVEETIKGYDISGSSINDTIAAALESLHNTISSIISLDDGKKTSKYLIVHSDQYYIRLDNGDEIDMTKSTHELYQMSISRIYTLINNILPKERINGSIVSDIISEIIDNGLCAETCNR